MQIHDLIQGSDEWAAFRKTKFGASEAAAMLGLSPKVTRNDLLHMKKTGIEREFSEWLQTHILDNGHAVEASARPHFEQMLGEELFPVTVSEGRLSASCDGLTLDGTVAWEHKQWNDAYAEIVKGGTVPPEHEPQCQQVLMLTGASYLLFGMSDGTPDRMVSVYVQPDSKWFARLRAGWEQFAVDLDDYVHVIDAPKPEAQAIRELPALVVHLRGEVASSNLPAFKADAERFIASIKTELHTDEDFVNADATVKFCDKAEKQLDLAKSMALAQTASIDELMRTVDEIQSQLRGKRLMLEKLVDKRKVEIKETIRVSGTNSWKAHIDALNAELAPLRLTTPAPDFGSVMKGKRTLATLREAVDTAVANAKIAANTEAAALREKRDWFNVAAADHKFIFADLAQIIAKPRDDFELTVSARIDAHNGYVAETKRQAEAREAESKAKEDADSTAEAQIMLLEPAEELSLEGATNVATHHQAARASNRNAQTTPPNLRLGQINERLAPVALTADGLARLGFAPAATDKSAKLYHEADFPAICAALIRHISAAQGKPSV